MPATTRISLITLTVLYCLVCNIAQAQLKRRNVRHHKTDSVAMELNSRIADSILRVAEIKDTTVPFMVNKIETYTFSLNQAENFFDNGFDTAGILNSLTSIERGLNFFHNRLNRHDIPMNLRNLNTALVMLGESQETLDGWNEKVITFSAQLNNIHQRIRIVKHDSSLQNDSLNTILHGQMNAVYNRSLGLDSLLHNTTVKINTLRNRLTISLLLVKDLQTEINDRRRVIDQAMWKQEEPPLLKSCATDYDASLQKIIQDALTRSGRVVPIFMKTTWDTRSINLGIWILLLIWFLIIFRMVRKRNKQDDVFRNLKFIKNSTILSSLLLLVTYGPFLYVSAPAAYVHLNELIRLFLLTIMLFPFLTRLGKAAWFGLAVLWISFAIDDILLDSAYGERWGLMIGSIFLIGLCLWLLRGKTTIFKNLEDSPARYWVLAITLTQILLSVASNLAGRVTLSKLLSFSAVDSLVLAMTLKVCCTILVEAVYTQSEVFHNRFFAFLNFVDLQHKMRKVLWIVAIGLWVLSILRNLMLYQQVSEFLLNFIQKPRTIGSFNFSYANGILFILIIWISSVLSQFVNFFFDESQNPGPQKKTRLGSIALLVRIGIWAAGFLIAIAAAGIPLNKISILIGALGVGIGFGLQNLVNNLVSGIIIAFERPIQIGDTIEIGGKIGTVQEIGVRSSQINNGEGANIIIPNGDLLSQQLINWTMHNRNKRLKILIGVPYTADFRKARDLILTELSKDEKIMRDPKPAVSVETLANNAVNFDVKFWVPDMTETGNIRNELMLNIMESFRKNEIPIT